MSALARGLMTRLFDRSSAQQVVLLNLPSEYIMAEVDPRNGRDVLSFPTKQMGQQ